MAQECDGDMQPLGRCLFRWCLKCLTGDRHAGGVQPGHRPLTHIAGLAHDPLQRLRGRVAHRACGVEADARRRRGEHDVRLP